MPPRLRACALLASALLLIGPAARAARDDAPGTRYPSMKRTFFDPLTGRPVWRLTTDAKGHNATNAIGDLASEITSWSPDSRRVVYVKRGHPEKPDGIYVIDVASGEETFVAGESSGQYAVFSRATDEVYYTSTRDGWPRRANRPAAGEPLVQICAVDLASFRVRVVRSFPGAIWIGPPVQNCDGSLLALFPMTGSLTGTFNDMSEQCVIVTPQGDVHPGWTFNPAHSSPYNADFAIWHPTDPKLLITRRFTSPAEAPTHVWHVDETAPHFPAARKIGHSAWHPNGRWFIEHHLHELEHNDVVKPLAIGTQHKSFNPRDAALGLRARLSFDGWHAPYVLFVRTLEEMEALDPRRPAEPPGDAAARTALNLRLWHAQTADPAKGFCLHYSDFSAGKNSAHTHAHWSPDGTAILWQSNVAFTDWGAPPGGVGSPANVTATDLFVVPVPPR